MKDKKPKFTNKKKANRLGQIYPTQLENTAVSDISQDITNQNSHRDNASQRPLIITTESNGIAPDLRKESKNGKVSKSLVSGTPLAHINSPIQTTPPDV